MTVQINSEAEGYKFQTAEGARAFCRVHAGYVPTCSNAGYSALPVYFSTKGFGQFVTGSSYITATPSTSLQLVQNIEDCRLSYKNMITAGLLGSLTGSKYRMGNAGISHPVLFSYALGCAAPQLTLGFLLLLLSGIIFGYIPWLSTILFGVTYAAVEVVIPWINSHSVDPIEEPWLVGKFLDEQEANA